MSVLFLFSDCSVSQNVALFVDFKWRVHEVNSVIELYNVQSAFISTMKVNCRLPSRQVCGYLIG